MLFISFLCSLVIYFGQGVLVGIGGRLGTSAAVSVLLCLVIKNLLHLDGSKEVVKN